MSLMKIMDAFELSIQTAMEIERRTTLIGQRVDGNVADHHSVKGQSIGPEPMPDNIVATAEVRLKALTEQLSRIMSNLTVIEHGIGMDTGAVASDPRRSNAFSTRNRPILEHRDYENGALGKRLVEEPGQELSRTYPATDAARAV
jgi:hypothetical protein